MALAPGTFPAPRLVRPGPASTTLKAAAVAAVPTPPTSRIFSFRLTTGDTTRSTRSSTRIKGPAIIRGVSFSIGGGAIGTRWLELGKAAQAVTEAGVALTTLKPYTALTERISDGDAGDPASRVGMFEADQTSDQLKEAHDLRIVVLDAEWFLTVTFSRTGAGGGACAGTITVQEAVDAGTLANFL